MIEKEAIAKKIQILSEYTVVMKEFNHVIKLNSVGFFNNSIIDGLSDKIDCLLKEIEMIQRCSTQENIRYGHENIFNHNLRLQ
jgi:hypothetical protein